MGAVGVFRLFRTSRSLRRTKFLGIVDDDRPFGLYVPPPTHKEISVFVLSAIGSIVAALLIAFDFHRFDNTFQILPWSAALIGGAHAIVLIGLLRFIKIRGARALGYVVVCVLFPIWGTIVGLFGFFHILPIVFCSSVWGIVLWYLLEDRLALVLFILIGLFPLAVLYVTSNLNGNAIPQWYPEGTVVLWHVPAGLAILVLGFRRRSVLAKMSTVRCQACGYDCVGIEDKGVCPECGDARVVDTHRDGNNWGVSDL